MTWPLVNPSFGYRTLSRFDSLSWRPSTSTMGTASVLPQTGGSVPRQSDSGPHAVLRRLGDDAGGVDAPAHPDDPPPGDLPAQGVGHLLARTVAEVEPGPPERHDELGDGHGPPAFEEEQHGGRSKVEAAQRRRGGG